VKNEIVDFVHVRGLQLQMNLMVGQLHFSASGSVEFKSASAQDLVSNFSAMLPFDMRSKVGDGTDRSFRAMQADQSGCRSPIVPNSSGKDSRRAGTFTNKKRLMRETLEEENRK